MEENTKITLNIDPRILEEIKEWCDRNDLEIADGLNELLYRGLETT